MQVGAADATNFPYPETSQVELPDITVRANIRGRDQGGFVREAQSEFAGQIVLPAGYRGEWGGQFENLERARQHRLSIVLPMTVILIFGLLFVAFGSAAEASLVLMSVPSPLVGGTVLLGLRGINLSATAWPARPCSAASWATTFTAASIARACSAAVCRRSAR